MTADPTPTHRTDDPTAAEEATGPAATRPPASPLLSRPGAVAGHGLDAGVAAHYGNPHREQRVLAEGLACVDLSHRGVVTVTGPDRLSWLHSLTSQQLTDLPPRRSTETLILTPRGRIEHALRVVDDGETTWLGTEPGAAPSVAAWLDSMRFMLRVEVADRTGDYATVGEPLAAESAPGEPLAWVDRWPALVGDTVAYGPEQEHPGRDRAWREVFVPRERLEGFVGERPLAGSWAAEALRVLAWRPRAGAETDERSIPHELDWLRTAVHLHKGCYRGQETVAKVHNLGRPPRRLVFLHLDGSGHTLPEAGDELLLGEKVVGRLTTVARHYEDGPVALAVIKRGTDPVAELVSGTVSAAQTVVVAP
ncbi:CAF17-like 4Fe-4S cluster assembly/insertion protein YgfZ [Ornithinicoccus halotolerans]|uniref:CAF17-like 4Fe-4S cluster assembly/insertion protein YgfZ n=1 Tax=Ornithinicoccus halotolerans TaxID=1748220 RepID=UPI0012964A46|nr:folate-binding protein YgfZ [Ornithinicoccus halotolerans]